MGGGGGGGGQTKTANQRETVRQTEIGPCTWLQLLGPPQQVVLPVLGGGLVEGTQLRLVAGREVEQAVGERHGAARKIQTQMGR